MSRPTILLLFIFSLVGSAHLQAQDLFGSTGSTTRSYSYVEAQWLTNLDTDGAPLKANILVAITDSISLRGEYFKQSFTTPATVDLPEIDLEGELLSAGLLYHSPLTFFANSDWVVGLSIGQVRVKGRAENAERAVSVTVTEPSQEVYAGIRRSLTDRLEGEVGLEVFRSDGENSVTGNIKMVYRVRPSIDVALAINEIGEDDGQDNLVGVGLRYTW